MLFGTHYLPSGPIGLCYVTLHKHQPLPYVCSKAGSKKSGTEQNSRDHITDISRQWSSIDSMPNFIYFFKFSPAEIKED